MRNNATVAVIIPALNEEPSIGKVIPAIPPWVDDIVVVDNGSTDRTGRIAEAQGAVVVTEEKRGYGSACMAGMDVLSDSEVVVFLDGDFSDDPQEMRLLVDPIIEGRADLVIGARVPSLRESGSLTLQQCLGNRLVCGLLRLFWKVRYTDLGPFRAIRFAALQRLKMKDSGYGWTVEMQIKAARFGLRVREVPVSYRRRIGRSKISGTLRGTLSASGKILYVVFVSLFDEISHE